MKFEKILLIIVVIETALIIGQVVHIIHEKDASNASVYERIAHPPSQ